jgi:hypothetical protein
LVKKLAWNAIASDEHLKTNHNFTNINSVIAFHQFIHFQIFRADSASFLPFCIQYSPKRHSEQSHRTVNHSNIKISAFLNLCLFVCVFVSH